MNPHPDPLDPLEAQHGNSLRPIEARDDPAMADIIRRVMTEFGAVGEGYSIEDAEVDALHAAYSTGRSAYFVAQSSGVLLGGAGVAPLLGGAPGTCELRKMYLLPEGRGRGLGKHLMRRCLGAARELGFSLCYLETLEHMQAARGLYRGFGFQDRESPLGASGHSGCNTWMTLEL